MSFRESEFFIAEQNKFLQSKLLPDYKEKMKSVIIILKSKGYSRIGIKKIVHIIFSFFYKNNQIIYYPSSTDKLKQIFDDYRILKMRVNTQKVDKGVFEVTNNKKNKHDKKKCLIF